MGNPLYKILGGIFHLILVVICIAQDLNHIAYTIRDGLPTNLTKVTIQDERGYIWIGTDAGLVRYDGITFQTYRDDLPNYYVKDLYLTRDNRLLVATDKGIYRIDNKHSAVTVVEFLPGSNKLTDSTIFYPKKLYEDRQGNIWISEPGAIVKYADGQLKRFDFAANYRAESYLRAFLFLEDDHGRLLASSQRGFLFQYDDVADEFKAINIHRERPFKIDAFIKTRDGALWAGGDLGIFKLNLPEELTGLAWQYISSPTRVESIVQNEAGDLYIGTAGDGLFRIKYATGLEQVEAVDIIPNGVINNLDFSDDGALWISSDQGIVLAYEPFFLTVLSFSNFSIQTLAKSRDQTMLATDGQVVQRFVQDSAGYDTEMLFTNPANSSMISSIAATANTVGIGHTDGTIRILRDQQETTMPAPEKRSVEFLWFDRNKQLWVCLDAFPGVVKIDSAYNIKHYSAEEGLNSDLIVIKESENGVLFGGGAGNANYLFRYDPENERFVNISKPLSLDNSRPIEVVDLAVVNEELIWLGTTAGLLKYENGDVDVIDGLGIRNREIKSVAVDDFGFVWLGSEHGLFRYAEQQVTPFTLKDGLPSLTMTRRSAVVDADQCVWVGSFQGIACWQAAVNANKNTARPVFRRLDMNGTLQDPDPEPVAANEFPNDSYFEAAFSAFSFPTEEIQYQTRLFGKADDWSSPTKEAMIRFTRLSPGKYRLQVRAQQTAYLWSEVAEYPFIILPPWYLSWWAYFLYFGLLGVAIWGGVKFRGILAERSQNEDFIQKMLRAVEQTDDIIFMTDLDGKITYVNPAFKHVYGYSFNEAIGRTPAILKSGKMEDSFYRELWERLLLGKSVHAEYHNRRKDGTLVTVRSAINPVFNTDESMTGFIAVQEDITEEKRAEAELKRYAADLEHTKSELENRAGELADTIKALEIAKKNAEEATRAKSEFLANMSHEIRTPMNGIIGMTELALDTELTDEQNEYLTTVKISADSLLNIINEILDFSKIEAGKLELNPIAFDLQQALNNMIKTVSVRAYQKELQLHSYIEPETPNYLIGDLHRLGQVILNLLGNAIKFTEQGSILLKVWQEKVLDDGILLHFAVSDTGIGVDEPKQKDIFKAFTQANQSRVKLYGGTGLGLTISSKIVKMMGGVIWVKSPADVKLLPEEAKLMTSAAKFGDHNTSVAIASDGNASSHEYPGSSFHFTARFTLQKEIPAPKPVLEERRKPVSLKSDYSLNILVTEDNKINQKLMIRLLEKMGHQVTIATNGREAIEKWEQSDPDLILMDVQMPEMDGFEATQIIREKEVGRHTPIVALTAYAMKGDRERCLEMGMDDYLSKPIIQQDLIDLLNKISMQKSHNNH